MTFKCKGCEKILVDGRDIDDRQFCDDCCEILGDYIAREKDDREWHKQTGGQVV